jgi:ribosome-associated protein
MLALKAVDAALEKKAVEPVLLDVHALASYTDYIVVVSGRSDRQVAAIADGVTEAMHREGARTIGKEGAKGGHWQLLDFGDVIVHVFYHPVRGFYDLESFWVDAPRVALTIPPEARVSIEDEYK